MDALQRLCERSFVAGQLLGMVGDEILPIIGSFDGAEGAAFLSDAADGDVASFTGAGPSVDAGDGNVANAQLNINPDAVWALLFSVKIP